MSLSREEKMGTGGRRVVWCYVDVHYHHLGSEDSDSVVWQTLMVAAGGSSRTIGRLAASPCFHR